MTQAARRCATTIGLGTVAILMLLSAPAIGGGAADDDLTLDPLLFIQTAHERTGPSFCGLIAGSSRYEAILDTLGKPTRRKGDLEYWEHTPLLQRLGLSRAGVELEVGGVVRKIGLELAERRPVEEVAESLGLGPPPRIRLGDGAPFHVYDAEGVELAAEPGGVRVIRLVPPDPPPQQQRPHAPHNVTPARLLQVKQVWWQRRQTDDERAGLKLCAAVRTVGFRGDRLTVTFHVTDQDGRALPASNAGREQYADDGGRFRVERTLRLKHRSPPPQPVCATVPAAALHVPRGTDTLRVLVRTACSGLRSDANAEVPWPPATAPVVRRALWIGPTEQQHDLRLDTGGEAWVTYRMVPKNLPLAIGTMRVSLRTLDGEPVRAVAGVPDYYVDEDGNFVPKEWRTLFDEDQYASPCQGHIHYAALDLAEGRTHALVATCSAKAEGLFFLAEEECPIRMPAWAGERPAVRDPRVADIEGVLKSFLDAVAENDFDAAAERCTGRMAEVVAATALPEGKRGTWPQRKARSVRIDGDRAVATMWVLNPNFPQALREYLMTFSLIQSENGWKITKLMDVRPDMPGQQEEGVQP
jgi:hypothetical protein